MIQRGLVRPAGSGAERLGKRVRHTASWIELAWRRAKRGLPSVPPAVVAWPDLPSRRTTLHGVCRELGWELTNRRRNRAVVRIRFEDATEKSAPIPENWSGQRVFNEACTDIRKTTLEGHHLAVFGYGMAVDPLKHVGALLEKGDGNALHDGRVITGPLLQAQVQLNKVYQTVIDNRDEKGRLVDLRVAWIMGDWPVAYLKFKSPSTRFTNETTEVELADAEQLFTPEERTHMGTVLERMGVDFGEVDMLRDRSSGRLYLVDVNPTPWGPPAGLAARDKEKALELLAQSFSRASTS